MSNVSSNAHSARGRILIVEDSTDYRTLLKRLFTREGYEVTCAVHGQDALTQLHAATQLPELILLDLMMPIMDGFEFRANQLNKPELSSIPVILMTAHGNLQTDPVKLGIRDCVRKPVEMTLLLDLVQKLIPAERH